ncbi:hypothetical protein [Desulfocurvibacter africanus]|uniref:hypothetical protein n=1 Tax=Desulfocurvibacter africanus TaxID=873 RepID=UPI0004027636|nr:hypothetical protein [Desulfocurvibacter africanus]
MSWKDVGKVVAKAAPVLGGVLGGPIGAVAGAAGELIASFFGVDSTPEAIEKHLSANPEALLKLKELELRNQEMLLAWRGKQLEHEQKMAELEIEDRDSARKRDMSKGRNVRGDVLAFVAIGGLVALILTLLFVQLEDGPARDVLLILAGGLVTIVKDVYGFEFGSSRGSKEKDVMLAGAVPTVARSK